MATGCGYFGNYLFGSDMFASNLFSAVCVPVPPTPVPPNVVIGGGSAIWPLGRLRRKALHDKYDDFIKKVAVGLKGGSHSSSLGDAYSKEEKIRELTESEKRGRKIKLLQSRISELEELVREMKRTIRRFGESETIKDDLRALLKLKKKLKRQVSKLEQRVAFLEKQNKDLAEMLANTEKTLEAERLAHAKTKTENLAAVSENVMAPFKSSLIFGAASIVTAIGTHLLVPKGKVFLKWIGYTSATLLGGFAAWKFMRGVLASRAMPVIEVGPDSVS